MATGVSMLFWILSVTSYASAPGQSGAAVPVAPDVTTPPRTNDDNQFIGLSLAVRDASTIVVGSLSGRRTEGEGLALRTLYDLLVERVLFSSEPIEVGQSIVVGHPMSMTPGPDGTMNVLSHGGAPKYLPPDSTVLFIGGGRTGDGSYPPVLEHFSYFVRQMDGSEVTAASSRGPGHRFVQTADGVLSVKRYPDRIPLELQEPDPRPAGPTPKTAHTIRPWADFLDDISVMKEER